MRFPKPAFFKRFSSGSDALPRLFRHTNHYERVLGTSLEVQVVAQHQAGVEQAEEAILNEIDRLTAIFNAYDHSSEFSQWQSTLNEDIPVSPELALVLRDAEEWRKRTSGAFNPAVEAVTRLWKEAELSQREPSPQQLDQWKEELRKPLWQVELSNGTAKRLTSHAATLNSIAKGFVIDRAVLAAQAIESVEEILVNIGGDIRHAGNRKVIVAIADPRNDAENAEPLERITLSNQGVATSGNYRRGFQVGTQWHSHLIDPRNGRPVKEAVGVSVVAPDAATADVLATAFSVLSPCDSLELANGIPHIGVLLVTAEGKRISNEFWRSIVHH